MNETEMLESARRQWPEMTGQPYIINAAPGQDVIIVSYPLDSVELLAKPRSQMSIRERWDEQLEWAQERIELEPVGPFMLGYGSKSNCLYVGAESS